MTKFCRYGAFEKERLSDKVSVVASDSWITVPFQTQCSKSLIPLVRFVWKSAHYCPGAISEFTAFFLLEYRHTAKKNYREAV